MNKEYLKQLLQEHMKKNREKLQEKKEAKRQLANAIIEKWNTIEDAILNSTIDCDEMEKDQLAFHLNLVAESLYIVKEAKYSRRHFEKVEINITLLEGELDSLEVSKSISPRLWELINISIFSFLNFLSYQMINSGK